MILEARAVVVGSPDAAADAFWTAVLGAPLFSEMGAQDSPQVRLELVSDDVQADVARLVGLGAASAGPELRSPAGVAFTLRTSGRSRGDLRVAVETNSPREMALTGQRVRLVQVSIDVPATRAAAEAGFWCTATGWRVESLNCSEFVARLVPERGSGVQLLLQRLDADDRAAVARAHLDLGCDDYRAAADRLVELGAVRQWDGRDGWVTLRDPAGMVFCATENSPDAPLPPS